MSKRLKAPRYKRLIAYLEAIMCNPQETAKSRTAAAFRLDELYARLDMMDEKSVAYKRRLRLQALKAEAETPLAPSAPDGVHEKDAQIKSVFDSVSSTEAS